MRTTFSYGTSTATMAPPVASPLGDTPIISKYIIIARDGREFPILFPTDLQHSEVLPRGCTAVSAGFYQFITADLILAGGESHTLNLRARIQDADIIKRHLLSIL